MRRSQLFIKTRREAPADEESKNAKLLIRGGFMHKEAAGIYALLPMGLAVIENIKQIVREEMNNIGGNELLMASLQRKELWEHTDRWDDAKVDIWFKSKLQSGTDVGLAWSHEEPITDMMREFIASYRDLPVYAYQFQTKFRNELRAKSGIMRAREFIMKDLYSYSRSEDEHQKFYDAMTQAYLRVFARLGLGDNTFVTFASGGAFTDFSHEFQTITENGEDTIYLDKAKKTAINDEVYSDEVVAKVGVDKNRLEKFKAAEVGNIFSFGTQKSQQLGLTFVDKDGTAKPVVLGSYGIGITRLMGVIAENFADDKGLVWPVAVAPAKVYLVRLGNSTEVVEAANSVYKQLTQHLAEVPRESKLSAGLTEAGAGVIYDDRDATAGEMFADADLMGIPLRLVVSDKTLSGGVYELKARSSDKVQMVPSDGLAKAMESHLPDLI